MRFFVFAASIWGMLMVDPNFGYAWNRHEEMLSRMTTWLAPELSRLPNLNFPQGPQALEILKPAVDEPDQGMDLNLPASADPYDERKWMGGVTGPSSQGFRHMYFAGWKWYQPIATFQIPLRPIGRAPDRVLETAESARGLLGSADPDLKAEGVRELGWSLHYIEDLAQPFHCVQLVNWRMAPWEELFHWPVGEGIQNFIREGTRTISNYHWLLENYVALRIQEGAFDRSFNHPEDLATVKFPAPGEQKSPKDLAMRVVAASVDLAPAVGRAEMDFFGKDFLNREYDLRNRPGQVDYRIYATRGDLREQRTRFEEVMSHALANMALATRALLEWALHP